AQTGSATLNINSIPRSNVLLDGRPIGQTPKIGVSVSPGSHTVVFVLEGEKKSSTVSVSDGSSKTVAVRF
ncbi:MAG TPA: PEGA domain-containing protein, partial [Polyangiaceae bacterium]|nr:PEGA domain-containing protein [Polyangiaceae bacterium]